MSGRRDDQAQAPAQPNDLARPVRVTPLEPSFVARAARALAGAFGLGRVEAPAAPQIEPRIELPQRPASAPEAAPPATVAAQPEPWMGPGKPLSPSAPAADVQGRAFDYPVTWNLNTTPRRFEAISFRDLRNLASAYDMLRLCIETRKDQLSKLGWSIQPRLEPGQKHRKKQDDRCRQLERFFRRPDGTNLWEQWIRSVAEDSFVIDAVALYRRRDRAGRPYALEQVDGADILPLLDRTGRRPLAPAPAFQQVLKGLPAVNYTTNELTYSIRNPRSYKVYGYSQVEQVITYANIGLRRMAGQLYHFTDGNVPDSFMGVPETWTPAQIAEFQHYFDLMLAGNQQMRARARFIPGGTNYIPTRADGALTDPFDEWLARVCCYAFSLPPFPFVKQTNRATAESMYDSALEEGLGPTIVYIKGMIDGEIADFHLAPDLELVWDDVRKLDAVEQQAMDMTDMQRGVISLDDIRAKRGQEATGLPACIWGIGPLGVMPVADLVKAFQQGLHMPQPMMPDLMGMGLPGAAPGEDPLAGAPPELLAQLGVAPEGPGLGQDGGPPMDEDEDPDGEDMGGPPVRGGAARGGRRSPVLARLRGARGDPRVSAALRGMERRGGR